MTTDVDATCLEAFPLWLNTLGEDGKKLVDLIAHPAVPDVTKRILTGALNYLFKSLDLIPDGIDDIGYIDDAFVLRVSAALALNEPGLEALDDAQRAPLAALGADAPLIQQFLGGEYARLEAYVVGLRRGTARSRSVDDILTNPAVTQEFAQDVRAFARDYTAPAFAREQKNLIKLRAFFDAKLPR